VVVTDGGGEKDKIVNGDDTLNGSGALLCSTLNDSTALGGGNMTVDSVQEHHM